MNLKNLNAILKDEPKFRQKQVRQLIFKNLISNWSEATNLSLELRNRLNESCPLEVKAESFASKDKKTERVLITLSDNLKVESVLMRHKDGRNTVCVSSQIGCPLGCLFCATGKSGFKRNLDAMEIVEQVLYFARKLKPAEIDAKAINNIVFMGMGEPFLNYDNVLRAIKILNDKEGLNIGARHISISTVGITTGIKKLSAEPLQINLAYSMHAPNDEIREKIIPSTKKYPIARTLREIYNYFEKTSRKVMIEYIMLNKINDSEDNAKELAGTLKDLDRRSFFVNLILYNETDCFKPSTSVSVEKFKKVLEKAGVAVTLRYRFGEDVFAACGQLSGNVNFKSQK